MLVALGVGLLATAVVVSTLYTRDRGFLDGTNFAMGVLASLALLGVAAAGWVLDRARDRETDLVAWPGAFGVVGVGLMIGVLMDDNQATAYVVGLVVAALAAGGYLLTRRSPFVLVAVAGLSAFYSQAIEDIFDLGEGGDNAAAGASAALLVFTIAVTVAAWWLPERVLVGVTVGAVAVLGNAVLLIGLGVLAAVQTAFSAFEMPELTFDDLEEGSGDLSAFQPERFDAYDNDVWTIVAFTMLLVIGWAACALLTRAVGYRLLVVAGLALVVPVAPLALSADHPTYWELVFAVLGGAVLAMVLARVLFARRAEPAGRPPS